MPTETTTPAEEMVPRHWLNEVGRKYKEMARKAREAEERAEAAEASLKKLQAEHETTNKRYSEEVATMRRTTEDASIKAAVPDLDPEVARIAYQRAVADIPEPKRPPISDWVAERAKMAREKPAEADRWLVGYLGEQRQAPPSDSTRRDLPPPAGGLTAEALESMPLEDFRKNRDGIRRQIGGR